MEKVERQVNSIGCSLWLCKAVPGLGYNYQSKPSDREAGEEMIHFPSIWTFQVKGEDSGSEMIRFGLLVSLEQVAIRSVTPDLISEWLLPQMNKRLKSKRPRTQQTVEGLVLYEALQYFTLSHVHPLSVFFFFFLVFFQIVSVVG